MKKNRLLLFVITICLILSSVMVNSFSHSLTAETLDSWDGTTATSFSSGTGSQTDPYVITKGSELAYLASQVNNKVNYADTYFVLNNDIDLCNYNWTAIGNRYEDDRDDNYFAGHFNGNNRTIFNLYFEYNKRFDTQKVLCGLFGYVSGSSTNKSTIENLNINNSKIQLKNSGSSNNYVGTLVATSNYCDIKNCSVNNENNDDYNVELKIDKLTYAGGLVGFAKNTNISYCSINTYITNNVSTATNIIELGGIIGFSNDGNTISNSSFTNNINFTKMTTDTKGLQYGGGLVGYSEGSLNITNCYAISDISNNFTNCSIAGLVGTASILPTISKCYYSGNLDQSNNSQAKTSSICNLNDENPPSDIFSDVYYLYDDGKSYDKYTNVEKIDSTKLADKSTFKNFDFDLIWYMDSIDNMPKLRSIDELPNYKIVYNDDLNSYNYCYNTEEALNYVLSSNYDMTLYLMQDVNIAKDIEFKTKNNVALTITSISNMLTMNLDSSNVKFSGNITIEKIVLKNDILSTEYEIINDGNLSLNNTTIINNKNDYVIYNNSGKNLSISNCDISSKGSFLVNQIGGNVTIDSSNITINDTVFLNYENSQILLNGSETEKNIINIEENDIITNNYILKNIGLGLLKISSQTEINSSKQLNVSLTAVSINKNDYQIECIDDYKNLSLNLVVEKDLLGEEDYYIAKNSSLSNNLSIVSIVEGVYAVKSNEYYLLTKNLKAYLFKDWKNLLPCDLNKVSKIEFITNADNCQDLQKVYLGATSDFTSIKTENDIAEDIVCYYETDDNELYELKIYSVATIICPTDSSNLFSDFTNLNWLKLINLNFKNVKIIDNMFANLTNLTNLDLSNLIFENLSSEKNVFLNSDSLYELVLCQVVNDEQIELNNNIRYSEFNSSDTQNKTIINKINKETSNKTLKACFELTINANDGDFDKASNLYQYNNQLASGLYFYDEVVGELPNATKTGYQIDKYVDENGQEFTINNILTKDTILTIIWKEREDVEYIVEVYYQDLDDLTKYNLKETKNYLGVTNSEIKLSSETDSQNNEYVLLQNTNNKILVENGFTYNNSEFYNGQTKSNNAIVNPNENQKLTIKIYINRKSYVLTINVTTSTNGGGANGGKIAFDDNYSLNTLTAVYGQTVKLYISKNVGYELKSLVARYQNDKTTDIFEDDNIIDFLVNQNADIQGIFELTKVLVTLTQSNEGIIKFVDSLGNDVILENNLQQEIYYNNSVYVKFVANNGYKFKNFILSNNQKFTNNPLTISNIISQVEVSVETIQIHTITANFNEQNGEIKLNNNSMVSGQTITDIETQSQLEFIFIPANEHFFCNYVKINNKNVDLIDIDNSNSKKLIITIDEDLVLDVEFDVEKFSIEFLTNIDSISRNSIIDLTTNLVTTKQSFSYGENLKFIIENVQNGYRIKNWKINGEIKLNQDNSNFNGNEIEVLVDKKLNIFVEFEILVTIEQNDNGTLLVNNNENSFYADLNSNLNVTINADRGYQIDTLLYDIKDLEVKDDFIVNLTKPTKIGVSFKSKVLKITLNYDNNACDTELTSNDTEYVIGSSIHFVVTMKQGYLFKNIDLSYAKIKYQGIFNKNLLEQNYIVTVDDVSNDELIIDVNTEIIKYNITINVQGKGEVTNSKLIDNLISFTYFDNEDIVILPNNTYKIESISIINDDESIEDVSKNIVNSKLTLPKKNCIINVVFSPITWLDDNIRAKAFDGGNGSMTEPFLISSPNQLALMSYLINNGQYNDKTNEYYSSCYYKLTKDISLIGNYWVPIGVNNNNLQRYMFTGVFDYQFHRINNSVVEDESITTIENNVFGVCHNAKFINKEKVNYMLFLGIGLSIVFFILFVIAIIIKKKINKKPKRVIVMPGSSNKMEINGKNGTNNKIDRPNFEDFFKNNKK